MTISARGLGRRFSEVFQELAGQRFDSLVDRADFSAQKVNATTFFNGDVFGTGQNQGALIDLANDVAKMKT